MKEMNPALKRQFEAAAKADAEVARQKQSRGREIGTVIMYDKGKGFGFIHDADGEKLFVHQSQIISPGFRRLVEDQKVSFLRGENQGRPWAEDVRNPDGTPMAVEVEEEPPAVAKKRQKQMKEQWRNFFGIPQYALKAHGMTLPNTVANQDAFGLNDAVPQLGEVFVVSHGNCATASKGNECAAYCKDKIPKYVAKFYDEKPDVEAALRTAIETVEAEWMERATMKSLTDGAELAVALFVHALNSSGQPCVQLWIATVGGCAAILCTAEGTAARVNDPHTTKKHKAKLEEAGFKVAESGKVEVAFAESGNVFKMFKLPAMRLIGGRPFKTSKKTPIVGKPDVKMVREWRCVAGEDLFLLLVSPQVTSVLEDVDIMNVALDAWGSSAEGLDGWEAASKAVVRTAQSRGPESDNLACMAVQFWCQEKPLQRLLARRADRKKSGQSAAAPPKPKDNLDDMFG